MLPLMALAWFSAQIEVYSEFRRIGPDGEIVKPDQGGTVRELLSPAVARGGHASFHIVVKGAAGLDYTLYIGQNPEGHARATLYRELFDANGLPDRLELIKAGFQGPHEGRIPEGQSAEVFWLDVEYPATAAVERVKVEPQLWAGSHWIVYPMEVRLIEAQLKSLAADRDPGVAVDARAESAAFVALRQHLCGLPALPVSVGPPTIRRFIYRNAREVLARATPASPVLPDATAYCKSEIELPYEGFLRLRGQILQAKPTSPAK
ncbi:MAG: hypothetical protein K2X03_03800 [Bryobacteraceae bacterium]|nr:hypothetical protein [Bryobacteraceae bacterium]